MLSLACRSTTACYKGMAFLVVKSSAKWMNLWEQQPPSVVQRGAPAIVPSVGFAGLLQVAAVALGGPTLGDGVGWLGGEAALFGGGLAQRL